MATQRTKFALGLFVTCGIGMAVMAIIWLGMSRYLEKGQYYATYFDESVQGLSVDSPVKYRGVSIGRVDRITVAPDADLIQVVLKIESGQTLDKDMVAQLKSVGITGSMFVELDRKKEDELDKSPHLSFPSEYRIVASKPSNISELWQGIDDVINKIRSVDLDGISGQLKKTLDNINGMILDADIKGISKRLGRSLDHADVLLDEQRWNRILTSIEASVEEAGLGMNRMMQTADSGLTRLETTLSHLEGITVEKEQDIKTAIVNFRRATEQANTLLNKGIIVANNGDDSLSRISGDLLVIVQNLSEASENLNRLLELISDHPSQLLLGEPPLPKKVDANNPNK
jgi:phospholipid/cholesterol/gamma-HCH transport system substrate-binding protein